MVLLDTSVLIFWTLAREKLSKNAEDAISCARLVNISSISIWEIGIKVKRGKLTLPLSLRNYVDRLKMLGSFSILPVTEEIWIKNIELDWDHKDPADRTIVATAADLACTLITSDTTIRSFFPNTIW
jgi:PIN domain nuclease of toxin-antitoxin system